MNKLFRILLIYFLITGCSFQKNSKFWNKEKIEEEKQEEVEIKRINEIEEKERHEREKEEQRKEAIEKEIKINKFHNEKIKKQKE